MNKLLINLSLLVLTASSFAAVAKKDKCCNQPEFVDLNCNGQGPLVFHPLDPLTCEEIKAVGALVRDRVPEASEPYSLFTDILLVEPTKESVKKFELDGGPFARRAQVILYNNQTAKTTEVIVAVCGEEVSIVNVRTLCGVFPNMNRINNAQGDISCKDEEKWFTDEELIDIFTKNTDLMDALKEAGYEDPIQDLNDGIIYATFNTFESFRSKEKCSSCPETITKDLPDHRYFPVTFADTQITDAYAAEYFSIVNGVEAVVDVTAKKVIAVIKTNNKDSRVTTSPENSIVPLERKRPLNSLTVTNEPSFCIENNVVNWDNWQFRLSWHSHTGLQLYNIKYWDSSVPGEDKFRSILYKASLTDALVSYNVGSDILFARNYLSLDSVHYPWMRRFMPLCLGADVPEYATLLNMYLADTNGNAVLLEDAVGIYEQDGDVLWRSATPIVSGDVVTGLRGRQLVVRSLFQGTYYLWIVSWIFNQDGTINVGIDVGGRTQNIIINQGAELTSGELIAPQEFSLNHTHVYNFRLDFDVDGVNNTVIEENQYAINDRKENPCGQNTVVEAKILTTEQKAIRNMDLETNRQWIVTNPNKKNRLGHDVGYELIPQRNGFSKSADYSNLHQQFSFIKNHLHVTRYHDNEQFASGEFPILQDKDTGLGAYVKDNECIENKDVVVWYTINFSHVPHTEDYPFITLYRQGFSMVPHNFFGWNAAFTDFPESSSVENNFDCGPADGQLPCDSECIPQTEIPCE